MLAVSLLEGSGSIQFIIFGLMIIGMFVALLMTIAK